MSGKGGPLRVLLVENDPLLGWLGSQALSGTGEMETVLAEDGAGGLELARTWGPDVILLDLILPVMSGMELLRQYRREGGRAKVLAITGGSLAKARDLVFALGGDELVGKPVRWGEIIDLIRLLAGGMEGQCRDLLLALGARESCMGFRQAAECGALLGEKKCRLLKEAYIEVAARHRTGAANVAKNIERLAREVCRVGTPRYHTLTGRKPGERPLTNQEFLDLLSQAAKIPL